MKQKILSILLVLALLCTCLPQLSLPARAEEEPDPLIGADEVVLEEITYSGTRIDTVRMLYRLAGEPEVEDMSCLDQFTDLDPEIYSEEALRAVAWAVSNGIASGTSQTTFSPEQITTKAQAITYVWKSFGAPAYEETDCPYSDVKPGRWYYNAVMWSLSQTDWLDPEAEPTLFHLNDTVYYYKLFQCKEQDGSLKWKLQFGTENLYACGERLVWSFDEAAGILSLSGTGWMWDYSLPENPAPWYQYRNEISSVSISNAAVSIGDSAFADCVGLTEVTLPQSVGFIGSNVFSGCTGLSSVTVLNSNLTAEGMNPFGDPSAVTLRGYASSTAEDYAEAFGYAFESLGSFFYTGECGKNGDNLRWSFESASGILEITGSGEMKDYDWFGAPWTPYNSRITALVLPDGMTSIGESAFMGCALTTVTIPSSVTEIRTDAFSWCSLSSVTIPEGVTTIHEYAFNGCDNLSSVTIPASVRSLSGSAFAHCDSMTRFAVAEGSTSFSVDADGVLYNANGTELVSFPRGLTNHYGISQNVNYIRGGAFSGCGKLESVTIPESVTGIDYEAFMDTSLHSVTLPESITEIKGGAFDSCEDLECVYNYSRTCSISSFEGTLGYPDATTLFGYLGSTTESYARRYDYRFVDIEKRNFGVCGENGGDNLHWFFDEDAGTLEITGSGKMESYVSQRSVPWSFYWKQIGALILSEGITSVGSYAFADLSGLSCVRIPEGVISVGGYAFSGCTGLNSVILPEGLISVGDYAFSGCTGLDSVILPEGLSTIGRYVFSNCTGLNSVILPKTLSSISSGCFQNCFALKNIKFSKNIAVIGESAFGNCSSLRSVSLPASLNKIEENAFKGCSSLKTVVAYNPDCLVKAREEHDLYDDSGEDLVDTFSREYSETLGVPGQTTIYGIHDSEKENSPEMVYTDENMGPIRDYNRYVESYAKFFGYTFQPLNAFGDVTPGSYYEIPVAWAVGMGITSGTGDGKFSPKQTCTREQVMTFLYAAEGKPGHTAAESPFTDVKPGKYYYHPVMWAVENGITGGVSSTLFGVGKPCTREQVVSFLWKAAGSPEPESTESPFSDVKPGKYYYKAVLWASENGVTSGVGDGKFGVGQSCTRAQIVTFLYTVYGK